MGYKIPFPGMTKFQMGFGGKALTGSPGIVPYNKTIGASNLAPRNEKRKFFKK